MSIDAGVAAVGRDAGMEAPVLGAAGVASMGVGVAMAGRGVGATALGMVGRGVGAPGRGVGRGLGMAGVLWVVLHRHQVMHVWMSCCICTSCTDHHARTERM
jgi:hypothetical protein